MWGRASALRGLTYPQRAVVQCRARLSSTSEHTTAAMSAPEPAGRVAALGPLPAAVPRGVLWCVAVVAVAYIAYAGLLLSADLLRVAPVGFVSHFDATGMTADGVLAGSPAARAGLRTGDHILRVNAQDIAGAAGLAARRRPHRSVAPAGSRHRAWRRDVHRFRAADRRSPRIAVRVAAPGPARVPIRAAHHAGARNPRRGAACCATLGASRSVAPRRDRHRVDRAARCAWRRSGTLSRWCSAC